MIKVLNETVKRNISSVAKIYKNCEYIMAVDSILDKDGYLIAMSDDISEYDDFSSLIEDYREKDNSKLYMMCGGYGVDAMNLQCEVDE